MTVTKLVNKAHSLQCWCIYDFPESFSESDRSRTTIVSQNRLKYVKAIAAYCISTPPDMVIHVLYSTRSMLTGEHYGDHQLNDSFHNIFLCWNKVHKEEFIISLDTVMNG